MTKEKEIVIISGFMGFAIGVCVMMMVNVDKEVKQMEKLTEVRDETKFIIQENISTCGDLIEWINVDIENKWMDSTSLQTYVNNLEQMSEDNQDLFILLDSQTEYDY